MAQTSDERAGEIAKLKIFLEEVRKNCAVGASTEAVNDELSTERFDQEIGLSLSAELPLEVDFRAFRKPNGHICIELSIDPSDPKTLQLIRDNVG